jgi:hypothetical protein
VGCGQEADHYSWKLFSCSNKVAVGRLCGAWWIPLLSYVLHPFGLIDDPSTCSDFRPTIWLVLSKGSNRMEARASHGVLAAYNLSSWKMLEQILSHGGSRVLTGQAPVQKYQVSIYHGWYSINKIITIKVSINMGGKTKKHGFKSTSADFYIYFNYICVYF